MQMPAQKAEEVAMTLKSKFDKAEFRSVIRILALSPSVAVSDTLAKGLVMSIAVIVTLIISELLVSSCKKLIPPYAKYSVCLVVCAFAASFTELLIKLILPSAAQALGVYLPILAVSCVVVMRLEYACELPVSKALEDSVVTGGEFLALMIVLSFVRELIGKGTLGCGFDGKGGLTVFSQAPLPVLAMPAGVIMLVAFGTALAKYVESKRTEGNNR